MQKIFEIRFHGRGGQGAKTASQLLAEAALDQGKFIQSFPDYGPERTGAPMRAYVRISDEMITVHSNVEHPDLVLVIDPTLLGTVDVAEGLTAEGMIIVNSSEDTEAVKKKIGFSGKLFTVDATKIALEELGRNIPNTTVVGALLKVLPVVSLDAFKLKVEKKMGKKIGPEGVRKNMQAIDRGYQEVK
jgi:pyruvate ferredoxin oxidoreductase gamma subunit